VKALILNKPGELIMGDAPKPSPGAGELLIRTRAAVICTSDLNDIRENPFGIRLPVIMGHEGAGVVEAVGEGVRSDAGVGVDTGAAGAGMGADAGAAGAGVGTDAGINCFSPGDRVAAHPVIPCGRCISCKRGLSHLCDDMGHLGLNWGGVFAEYFLIRQDRARRIPASLSFTEGALMEPVCVCIEALERGNVREGSNVLIIGDGPFGIITAKLCASYKPARIIISGRHPYRLSRAEGTIAINDKTAGNTAEAIMRATDGEGVDSAIICAGRADAVSTGIEVLRSRGTLCLFSAVSGKTPVDLFKVHVKELNICGSCNEIGYMDKALELLCDRKLNLGGVITHDFPFARWSEAFTQADKGKDSGLKVSMCFD
jgi:threonine dehydrogenase-like Zn-dependent dehydrogenase